MRRKHPEELSLEREKECILRVQLLNDELAFSELVQKYQSRIRGFLCKLCSDIEDANDISQVVFLLAYRNISTYRLRGSFSGWLFKIAYNCFLREQEKLARRKKLSKENIGEQIAESLDSNAQLVARIDIEKALLELNQVEKSTITLCYTIGLSHSEIAEVMDLPLGTVKSSIRRGLIKLRELLGANCLEKTQ